MIDRDIRSSTAGEAAAIKIDATGSVTVALGTVPQGQGHETVSAQIVADELGIRPDEVTVLTGFDTAKPAPFKPAPVKLAPIKKEAPKPQPAPVAPQISLQPDTQASEERQTEEPQITPEPQPPAAIEAAEEINP